MQCTFEDGLLRVEPSDAEGRRPHHDGAVAGVPERPGQPRDRAGDAGATGRTLVHDWMYELRLFALEQLSGMHADLFLCDPHRIIVTGARKLRGPHARQP